LLAATRYFGNGVRWTILLVPLIAAIASPLLAVALTVALVLIALPTAPSKASANLH
jgi:hypothetical protein